MAIASDPLVDPDPDVRLVRPGEVGILLPASVAMFTEEVGVSPIGADGGAAYRARVSELVAGGRSLARIEDGKVVFKAEIGAVTSQACQVQGVWVPPELRGRGHARRGMAAVVGFARRSLAPGGQPVCQRLQHAGQGRLPRGRLHRDRHVHVRAVLAVPAGPAGTRLARQNGVTAGRGGARLRCPCAQSPTPKRGSGGSPPGAST